MLEKYKEYVKNNPEGYWFKRKLYGWGWTPAKWQGWTVIAVYLGSVYLIFRDIDTSAHSGSDALIGFSAPFVIATALLLYICYKKGESPRWQWGIPKDNE